ncbi:MAG: S8 family peptidase [Saprospiraceae bacterium]
MKILTLILFVSIVELSGQIVAPGILQQFNKNKEVNVIIELKSKADLSTINPEMTKLEKATLAYQKLHNTAIQSQYKLIQKLKSISVEYHSFFIINAIAAKITKDQLDLIVGIEDIKYIHLDESISLERQNDAIVQNLKARGPMITWGIERIEANKVWNLGYEGQGVVVAGEDTGYKWDLEGIKEKYRGYSLDSIEHNYNWHDAIHNVSPLSGDSLNPCGFNLKAPCDDDNHGSHTMGTMVGSTATDAYGISPKAKWIGCRNMERGNGALSTYIECFEFFLAPTDLDGLNPKPELSPSVVNNSWYCSRSEGCDTNNFSIMDEAVSNLRNSGVVVVVSAGNDGQACGRIAAPAGIYKSSFVVGAFAEDDQISYFSSSGPVYNYKDTIIKPDVVAPGSAVISRIRSGDLVSWDGTSMAGPHVAGLVALIISANPALNGNVNKIEKIIKESARRAETSLDCPPFKGTDYPNYVYGYGKIMAFEAIKLALITKSEESEKSKSNFYIIPNPVADQFRIIFNQENLNYQFVIVNSLGQISMKINNSTSEINTNNLVSGTYLLLDQISNKSIRFIKL